MSNIQVSEQVILTKLANTITEQVVRLAMLEAAVDQLSEENAKLRAVVDSIAEKESGDEASEAQPPTGEEGRRGPQEGGGP